MSSGYKYHDSDAAPIVDLDILENLSDPITLKDIEVLYALASKQEDKLVKEWFKTIEKKPAQREELEPAVMYRIAAMNRLGRKLVELYELSNS